ncbi:MAG TPA: hypothetical protein VNZ52_04940, partial [Candidatus Thermoplasmatota archaeon]|nr:hypothetical protein [Candidatus Thermoplasmatota archaeon]
MVRTSFALLAGSLVCLAALAGCVTDASSPTPNGGAPPASATESDALEHLQAARDEAALWNPQARLVAIHGTEGAPLSPANPPFVWDTSMDPTVGNGQALVWTYAFIVEGSEEKAFFVSMSGSGERLYAQAIKYPYGFGGYGYHGGGAVAHAEDASSEPCCNESPPEHRPVPEIGTPTIGSGAAALAAAAGHAAFNDFATLHPVHQVAVTMFAGYGSASPPWV